MSDTPKQYYTWEMATGLFVSVGIAHESPEEPGVYMLPAFATFDVPPICTPGVNVAVYVEGKWMLVSSIEEEQLVPKRTIGQRVTAAWKALW